MHSVCATCGSQVGASDDFCGTCGAYLAWDRGAQPSPRPDPPAPPASEPRGDTERRGDAEPPADAAHGDPDPPQPVPVQPAKPVAPRPESHEPVVTVTSDGPPCPSCGTPNPPERRFCRRCAASLVATADPTEPPWWRRSRPRGVGDLGWLWRRLAILGLVAGIVLGAVLLYPAGQWLVQDVLDKISRPARVAPEHTVASGEVEGHPAHKAVDLANNVYWGAPAPGAWIEFGFERPFRLLSILVTPGPSAKSQEFRAQARPSVLAISVVTADGQAHRLTKELADQPGAQEIVAGISDVTRVRIVVRDATGLTDGRHIAVGEIEFYRRS